MTQVVLEDKDWSEIKQFKDPVYGYIPVCRAYVKSLIDTQLMQRIKGVAQTGLRPVFSSATHDRFSHSLGVYKFGMEMYKSLDAKLPAYVKDLCCPRWGIDGEEAKSLLERLKRNLKHWETLLAIGCLLHDIGHPVQSHGFEFLYDDPYLDMEYDKQNMILIGDRMDSAELERVYNVFVSIPISQEKTPEGNLSAGLLRAFSEQGDVQSRSFSGTLPGKPHERMSAYYIFKDDELRDAVKGLIRASRKNSGLTENGTGQELCFIARMIIGWEYPVARQLSFDEAAFFDSIKNCVIHILNGTIDADGIDYLMRNSYTAGYDTSRIDSARLCNAYTAYAKNYVMFPAFYKSALSVLEGYMSARNFEPKWLYSHHKVVYADLLTKQLYKYITRYLTDRTMLLLSVKQFLVMAPDSAIVCDGPQSFDKKLLLQPQERLVHLDTETLHSHMEQWSYPFYTYLLAACCRYSIGPHYFYQSADADMDALFHWVLNELAQYEGEGAQKYASYRKHLQTQILDELLYRSPGSISPRNLRILMAENCLHELGSTDETVRQILRAWIESGNGASALQEVEKLGSAPSALTELFELSAGEGENQERALLTFWFERYQLLLAEGSFENFIQLLEEYQTRCYRSSLWKSEAEYHLFLKDCARELGISLDDVHRYMEALITKGMEEHGFSIFDGKVAKQVPGLYREQFYYLPPVAEVSGSIKAAFLSRQSVASDGRAIARKWAADIFAATEQYDFSRNNLVIKFYQSKPKRFNKIDLLFSERVVPLEEVFPYHKGGGIFPYLYYNATPNRKFEHILGSFRKKFIGFCREYRESEVKSEVAGVGMSHVFRDAVYGDIKMTEDFYAVVCTKEFQRLGRIRQLATADRRFPNATHTRLAHSLGTWYVMRLILDHFQKLYHTNRQLRFTEEDRSCALLAALLHDLGHGPYSHMVETVFHLNHEEMTRRIILDPHTEVHQMIEAHFGAEMPQRVCKLLDSTPLSENPNGIDLIYRSVISGQLDADRIDYLVRDNIACGMAFGHIDVQQLIASMRLMPDYRNQEGGGGYCLCFDDRYLSAIEQFVYARYQMYRNVYHDSQKQLFEQIFEQLFQQAFSLLDAVMPDPTFELLKQIHEKAQFEVSSYLCLDDEAVDALIKKWADGCILSSEDVPEGEKICARMVKLLARAFLYQSQLFEPVDLGGHRRQYDLLAKRVGKQLDKDCGTFGELNSCAFIYIQGNDCAYESFDELPAARKNIILRNMDDGTTCDYAQRSLFHTEHGTKQNSVLTTDYCYLFFSEELLKEDCKMHGQPEEIVKGVKQAVESAKPRRHIEIEKKFYCMQKQMEQAEKYLDQKYPTVAKTKKAQTDTYFDCRLGGHRLALFEKQFSFRRREKDGSYVFTVKIPTDSPNYRSPAQFARQEHELIAQKPDITDEVWQFLLDTLDICDKGDLSKDISKDRLEVQLVVYNKRITYRLEDHCEICLDTVDYKNASGDPVGSQNYQIEIELLGEPEAWVGLENDVIVPLVQTLGEDSLDYTNKSKLEKGMDFLMDMGK